jgi:NHL repeat
MELRRNWSRRASIGMISVLFMQLAGVAGSAAGADAAVQPLFQLEPSVGAANGSVVATGTGFAAGQAVTVTNETTSATVCSATVAPDGTFSCHGLAGAVPGTVSTIGAGTSAGTYQAVGPSEIATVAGGGYGDGGPSRHAALGEVQAVATDAAGDVFFDNIDNNTVRRIDASTGVITTVAGVSLDVPAPNPPPSYGGDGGPATLAYLNQPLGLAVDQHGDLFIADFGNNRVREVSAATGIITTVAGNGTAGFSGDGGAATKAELNRPEGLAVDSHGNLFIGDAANCRIREVSAATGIITTVAGSSTCGYGGDGGPATSAVLANHLPGTTVPVCDLGAGWILACRGRGERQDGHLDDQAL